MPSNPRSIVLTIGALILSVYLGAIWIGLHIKSLAGIDEVRTYLPPPPPVQKANWTPPTLASIPAGPLGDSIRHGLDIFNETPLFAGHNVTANISCADCHAEGGIQPYASPMVAVPATFPQFNARAGHIISLKDRIQECFVRSENGKPLDYDGTTMMALVNYINWLSQPEPNRKPYVGRGLEQIPDLTPDMNRGRLIYADQCMGCHGSAGEGKPPKFPPLWGPYAFNDGAGMHGTKKMAAFIRHNMPQNRMGILTAQQAWDVAAFIHDQPRPEFNQAYKHF